MSEPRTRNYAANVVGILFATALLAAIIWRLPINGWGSILWFLTMAVTGIIRRPHEQLAKGVATQQSRQDLVENLLLFGVVLGSALLPALHLVTGVFSFADYEAPTLLLLCGVLCAVPGLWLFWRSHADLGHNWSFTLEIREDHGLITRGIYTRIRHPMYAAIFLLYGAQALFIHNWIAGLSGLVAFGLMYVIRVPIEEAMMREQFGEAYDEYCTQTGRMLPRLGS
ncbi:MAG: protein-S-isoprenylcysteine O-methyltransferase [Pseudomonadota bacterium]